MDAVVALDAGTTGARAIAFSANGKPLGSAYQEFPQYFPQPGWVEHDATEIWDALLSVMSALKQQLPDTNFTALGITVQRETVVVWDRTTHLPLHRAIVWQDRRTAERCEQLESELSNVRQISGLVLDPYFSGSKLEWIFSHTDLAPSENVAVGTIDSWIVWNLTKDNSDGAVHVTDTTNASRTMLCDIRTGEWSDELCAMFSIPKHVLPRIVPSSGRVGTTSSTCPLGAVFQFPELQAINKHRFSVKRALHLVWRRTPTAREVSRSLQRALFVRSLLTDYSPPLRGR